MSKKQKLELTWIGKDERPKLEPRILIEDPEFSYHADKRYSKNDQFDNILIQGDNLLALKALEQDYAGKVKCIYIDPPFNTGAAFEHYDDGLEHSIWLGLMKQRLELMQSLLTDDGIIFVHIDDKEQAYLKILLDEVFGRHNFLNMLVVKTSDPSGHKTVNPSPYSQTEYIYMYSKDRSKYHYETRYTETEYDAAYGKFIENINDHYSSWITRPLNQVFCEVLGYETPKQARDAIGKLDFEKKLAEFAVEKCDQVFQATAISNAAGKKIVDARDYSKNNPDEVICIEREEYDDVYILAGRQIYFFSNKIKEINGKKIVVKPLTNLWTDIPWNGIAKEGSVSFKNGKKPEKLLERCIELGSSEGDIVLDSFGGSGTTAAVAHKMGRKWMMVELGEHAQTHIIPRLNKVIDGQDNGGITEATGWKGGGGYRFYRLAPSLLEKDPFGNWVISKDYDPNMLSAAICKVMGFTYAPSDKDYWNHGYSTESDFIFVTTNAMTHDALVALSAEVGPDRSLLVCCKAFNSDPDFFDNLTLKKIPHAVMDKCEWGKDDYSLNVQNLPMFEDEDEDDEQDLFDLMDGDNA